MNSTYWNLWKRRLFDVDLNSFKQAEFLRNQILAKRFADNELVLIKIKNPYFFAATYFSLLEKNVTPILVPATSHSPFQCRFEILDTGIEKRSLPPQISPYKNSFAVVSSGSTGEPKLFYHSIESARTNALLHVSGLEIEKTNTVLQTLPLSHIFGVIAYLWTPLVTECRVRLEEVYLGFRSYYQYKNISTLVHLTPHLIDHLKKDPFSYSRCIEKISVGAGILSYENAKFLLENICKKLYVTYGLTEAGPRVSSEEVFLENFVSYNLGFPLENIETRIFLNSQLQTHGEGFLAIKTPCMALNLSSELNNGYFVTSDIVEITPSGRIEMRGRAEDVLKIKGHRLFKKNLEDSILSIPEVSEVYIMQILDAEEEKIRVYLSSSLSCDTLRTKIVSQIPALGRNFDLIIIAKLPRTSLGKVDRIKLVEHSM